jgi:hypothetical protein
MKALPTAESPQWPSQSGQWWPPQTGQRGDHRVEARIGGAEPPLQPRKPSSEEKKPNEDSKPANQVTTGFGVGLSGVGCEKPKPTPSACEPLREFIELGLKRDRNAMAIWQDPVAEMGFRRGYGTVKRFVRQDLVKSPNLLSKLFM